MRKEYKALIKNHTWELVSLPSRKKKNGFKWMYKVKLLSDHTLDKYKSRVVAKDYH